METKDEVVILMKGEVVYLSTPGREDTWVKRKVKTDHFLALRITEVNGQKVETTQDFYEKTEHYFPEIYANDQKLNIPFEKPALPPNATDMPHISLGYFGDFRVGENVENEVDENKVTRAKNTVFEELPINFSVTKKQFKLVVATQGFTPDEKNYINTCVGLTKERNSKPDTPERVGGTQNKPRDAILTFRLDPATEKELTRISKTVFGDAYVVKNQDKIAVGYHITVGQTNDFQKTIKPLMQQTALSTHDDQNKEVKESSNKGVTLTLI